MEPGRVSTDREALYEIQAALRRYAEAFDAASAALLITPELLRERDAAHDALLAIARGDTQPPVHRDDYGTEWARGYYCAVAILLREDGLATPHVRSLYRQGGGAEHCDREVRARWR